jgi:hypothetical protein
MSVVETVAPNRREHLVKGKTIKEIATSACPGDVRCCDSKKRLRV